MKSPPRSGPEARIVALPDPLPLDARDLEPAAVQERLRGARSQGRPHYVWPEVAPGHWRGALGAVGKAVAALVTGSRRVDLQPSESTEAVGVAAFTSGTGPLLGYWIESGRLNAPPALASLLLLHLEHGRRRALRLETGFAKVGTGLVEQGVRATVIKGFHTGRAFFPEPGTRPISDIDLVVRADRVAGAGIALAKAGFTPRPVLTSPYMCEWSPPGEPELPRSLELTHVASPWTVDLHASFERDFGGAHRIAPVPDGERVTAPWGVDARFDVLIQPYLTAYLAAHASQELKNLTLVRLVELVWVIENGVASGTLAWPDLLRLLERQGAARFVYPALELAERLAPGTLDAGFRASLAAATPERVRRIVAGVDPWAAQRLEGVSLEEQFMWVDGPGAWMRRTRRALWPAWAGPWPAVLRVQAARLRQLVTGRVWLRSPRHPR